jgi:hypothetical protein
MLRKGYKSIIVPDIGGEAVWKLVQWKAVVIFDLPRRRMLVSLCDQIKKDICRHERLVNGFSYCKSWNVE